MCALLFTQAGTEPTRAHPCGFITSNGTNPSRQARSSADPCQRAATSRARSSNPRGETRWNELQEDRSTIKDRHVIVFRTRPPPPL
ncbi:hypothetical protein ACFQX6_09220 [Streptosporangium lutulentum]